MIGGIKTKFVVLIEGKKHRFTMADTETQLAEIQADVTDLKIRMTALKKKKAAVIKFLTGTLYTRQQGFQKKILANVHAFMAKLNEDGGDIINKLDAWYLAAEQARETIQTQVYNQTQGLEKSIKAKLQYLESETAAWEAKLAAVAKNVKDVTIANSNTLPPLPDLDGYVDWGNRPRHEDGTHEFELAAAAADDLNDGLLWE